MRYKKRFGYIKGEFDWAFGYLIWDDITHQYVDKNGEPIENVQHDKPDEVSEEHGWTTASSWINMNLEWEIDFLNKGHNEYQSSVDSYLQ